MHDVALDAISDDVRRSSHDWFTRFGHAPDATNEWEVLQFLRRFMDARDQVGRGNRIVLLDLALDAGKIGGGSPAPSQRRAGFGGGCGFAVFRLLTQLPISSFEMTSPASAWAMPSFTAVK